MKYVIGLLGALLAVVGITAEGLFTDWYLLVGGTVLVTEFVKGLPQVKGILSVIVSWGLGIVFTGIGYFAGLGFLLGVELWEAVLIAISVALSSNGFYSVVKHVLLYLGFIKPEAKG